MNRIQFWKNFNLGEELDIAGRFIYNGLLCFHHMETLYFATDIFEALYNLSVGLERLLKVVLILVEHDDSVDQKGFELSIRIHDHSKLLSRIKSHRQIKLTIVQEEFLSLLSGFYKTSRYSRYDAALLPSQDSEKAALHSFLTKNLKIEIKDDPPIDVTPNSKEIREYIGAQVGAIAQTFYQLVKMEAGRLNIFTYEIRPGTKAAKIFVDEDYDFYSEELLWKELIVFFANSKQSEGMIGYLRELTPLGFDPALATDYLQSFSDPEKRLWLLDELISKYDNLQDAEERKAAIRIIGEHGVRFGDHSEEDSEGY